MRRNLVSGLVLLLIMMVVGYMAYYIYEAVSSPFKTAEAVLYTAEEIVSVKGYFFRDEIAVRMGDNPVQKLLVSDGEKVRKGQVLSVSYASEEEMRVARQLEQTENLISLLMEAVDGRDNLDVAQVDRNIYNHLVNLAYGIGQSKSVDLSYEANKLKSYVLKRGLAFSNSGSEQASARLSQLTNEKRRRSAMVNSGAALVKSPVSGYFSSNADGFEGILTVEKSNSLTLSEFSNLEALKRTDINKDIYGRLGTGFEWRFAVGVPENYAKMLTVGSRATLRFTGDYIGEVRVTVLRIDKPQNGTCLVLFSGTTHVSELLGLRYQSADIVLSKYEGIRIPKQALRINEEGKAGVYCLVALQAKFVEVEQIYELDHHYIVRYDPEDSKGLRPGEEIIVSSKNLYDGKIMQ
jgi:hypothetical protein